ncbi:MAG: acyl-CoA dehydrogenase family protein, partial [Desulfotomaculales bacterium]
LLVEDAAETLDSGKASGYESALAKCYATDMAMQVVTDSAQVLGGAGLLVHPLERNLWEAKLLQILEGTNQIQRLIVARALLGANRKKS